MDHRLRSPRFKRNMNWFARILAHHPYVILVAVAVFASTCMVIPLATRNLPSFGNPQLGFESRGTKIAQRLTAWQNLVDATKANGPLTVNPGGLPSYSEHRDLENVPSTTNYGTTNGGNGKSFEGIGLHSNEIPRLVKTATKSSKKFSLDQTSNISFSNKNTVSEHDIGRIVSKVEIVKEHTNKIANLSKILMDGSFSFSRTANSSRNRTDVFQRDEWNRLMTLGGHKDSEHFHDFHDHSHLASDGYFCSSPSPAFSRVVFTSTTKSDLFNLESILDMCHLEQELSTGSEFYNLCEKVSPDKCCSGWSLGNYIALLHNRSTCFNITEEDVEATKSLLKYCTSFFYNLELSPDCPQSKDELCRQVPSQCRQHDAVYNMLYYLIDTSASVPNGSFDIALENAMYILPIGASKDTLDFYYSLDLDELRRGNVKVVAMEFGLKNTLFDECLVNDAWLIGSGGLFVLICMWLYTGSLFVTLMTVVAIAFSLGISYFMYTLVFELHFFPFMNLLASVVAVGIGADDAFIFCKVWKCAKSEKNNGTSAKLVHDTLRHATLSMFVTSLTTAAAFYASYVSSITAIGCFSVFAGTATLANFLLMVTWLPASVVVSERWSVARGRRRWAALGAPVALARVRVGDRLNGALLPLVVRLRYAWLLLLGGGALASLVVIFYWPRLRLPDSRDFQLFESGHPFELYDFLYRDRFFFERFHKSDVDTKLPLRFVWGILPVDGGNYLDPGSRGAVQFDSTFDVAAPDSQEWLLEFCRSLRRQAFYQPTRGPLLPNCFIESFMKWMDRRCRDPSGAATREPCCETEKFPYRREVFDACIVSAVKSLYETPIEIFIPGVAGPKFGPDRRVRAVVVEYDSKHPYSVSFTEMNAFYQQVEAWTTERMRSAPPGMRNGWFVSELDFYELQRTLSADTLVAVGVSMGVALAVLASVTLNVLVSLYAVLTITCVISVTVGALVLLGWRLNVLESVAVTVAVGLSVDFSLHYGVHYRLSPRAERRAAVAFAVSRVGGPTAMAALTTAAAGAFMLPSSVLAYGRVGVFLVVLMVVSWLYSTFFLGSLLCVGGPQHGFGQFSYPTPWRRRGADARRAAADASVVDHVDQVVYANVLSESTLSTSSTVCPPHELEALGARQPRRSPASAAAAAPEVSSRASDVSEK